MIAILLCRLEEDLLKNIYTSLKIVHRALKMVIEIFFYHTGDFRLLI